MGRFVVGRGNVTIEVEDGIDEMLERFIRAAAPRTVEALERELDKIVDEARAAWPVGKERTEVKERGRPHSRDLFDITFRIDPSGPAVEAVITNRALYAYRIKSGGKSPWQELVMKKVKAAEWRIAQILADELAAVIDGR